MLASIYIYFLENKLNTDKIVFINIATTDYSFEAQILRLSIVDIHNNILFDCSFSSLRQIVSTWRDKTEKSDIDFSTKIDEILSILKDKVVIAYNAKFILSILKENLRNSEERKLINNIKNICLMDTAAYIFQESYYHNVNYLKRTCTDITIRYQKLFRVVRFYKIDNYVKDFLYFDYVCNVSALEDTFVLTHIFSKILSYTKDDYSQQYTKYLLTTELKQCGVIQ